VNKEFSAGAIIYRKTGRDILYLIIYSGRNKIWGFPKGHLEHGETAKEAAIREIREETGLKGLRFIDGFKEEIVYKTISKRPPFKGQRIEKHVTYFLCGIKNQDIIVDGKEITDSRFLPLNQAEEMVRFCDLNSVLRRAHDYLS